jgi:hypothetical protein
MALLYFAAVLISEDGRGSPAVMRRQQVRQSGRALATTSALVETSAIEVSLCTPTALEGSLCLLQVFDLLVETLGVRG